MTSDINSIDVLALADPGRGAKPDTTSLDDFYTVLADERRRRLLDHLASVGRTRVDALVEAFAGDAPDRFENVLHHVHLPSLVDADVVTVEDGVVDYAPPAAFDRLVDRVTRHAGGPDAHPADEAFDLLADARRRRLLTLVGEHRELALPDVADEVAIDERDASIVDIDPDTVLDVYLSLYHDHVPRLVEAGLVEYDQERDLVAVGTEGASPQASPVDD
jgi:predicted transcriptional regulator